MDFITEMLSVSEPFAYLAKASQWYQMFPEQMSTSRNPSDYLRAQKSAEIVEDIET